MEKKNLSTGENTVENKKCYMVKVPSSICKAEEIILFADKILIENGSVAFIIETEEQEDIIVLFLSAGNIKTFYLVDPDDGFSSIGIHRWQGVTGIRHILDQEMVNKAVEKSLGQNEKFQELISFIVESVEEKQEEIIQEIIGENVVAIDDEVIVTKTE